MKYTLPRIDPLLQAGLLLMVIKVSLSQSRILLYPETVDTLLALLSSLFLVFSILRQSFTPKLLTGYALVTLAGLYTVFVTGNFGFLITLLTCLALRNADLDDIVRHIFFYESVFFVVHACYALLCRLFFAVPLWHNIYGTLRFSLGFIHPNMLSIYLFHLILMWVWLNYSRLRLDHIGLIGLIAAGTFLLTKTRTSLINVTILCLLLLLAQKCSFRCSKLLALAAKWVTPLLAVGMLFLCTRFADGNPIILWLDRLLTTRIRLGAYAYEHVGITLFGQDIRGMTVTWDDFWQINSHTFDNLYSSLAMNYGLIWLVLICVCFYFLAGRQDDRINISLIIWSLYAMTEVHGLNGFLCFPIFLIPLLFTPLRENGDRNAGQPLAPGDPTDPQRKYP